MTRAPISINIHDSHFGIWQNNAQNSIATIRAPQFEQQSR